MVRLWKSKSAQEISDLCDEMTVLLPSVVAGVAMLVIAGYSIFFL